MIVYLDTSALVKLYVEEEHSDWVHAHAAEAEVLATSAPLRLKNRTLYEPQRRRERGVTGRQICWKAFIEKKTSRSPRPPRLCG